MPWVVAGSCPSACWATDGASYPVPLLRRTGAVQTLAFAALVFMLICMLISKVWELLGVHPINC